MRAGGRICELKLTNEPPSLPLLLPDCPSCVSHITAILEPFSASSSSTPQLYDLSISYLTHKVAFRLAPSFSSNSATTTTPSSSSKETFIQDLEALIREAGFDVERISPIKPGKLEARRDSGEEGHGHASRRVESTGWLERWTGTVGRKEKERRERRRRHVEVCEECQRDEAEEVVVGKGKGKEATREEEKLELRVEEPGKPKILETVFSVEGMFCG